MILAPGETQEFQVQAELIPPERLRPGTYQAEAILTNPQPWYIMDQMRQNLVRVWRGKEIVSPPIKVQLHWDAGGSGQTGSADGGRAGR